MIKLIEKWLKNGTRDVQRDGAISFTEFMEYRLFQVPALVFKKTLKYCIAKGEANSDNEYGNNDNPSETKRTTFFDLCFNYW